MGLEQGHHGRRSYKEKRECDEGQRGFLGVAVAERSLGVASEVS